MHPLYGNQKATKTVSNSVSRLLNIFLDSELIKEGDFLSPRNADKIYVRVPKPESEYIRPINYISIAELAEAMLCIAGKSFGIRQDDLYIKTAREFGFNRTGGNIIQAFQEAYTYLKNRQQVKEVDGDKVILI